MLHKKIELRESGSFDAYATTYLIESNSEIKNRRRPVVIICPGGAYMSISDREGEPIALRFLAEGYHAIVLHYSVYPNATYPTALLELGRVVSMLREKSDEWLIDKDKIILMGFSAGGHLAASYSCFWTKDFISRSLSCKREELMPNALILGYPVITSEHTLGGSFRHLLGDKYDELLEEMSLEKQVNTDNPPTFMWHTVTDEAVSYKNSVLFEAALKEKGISAQLHLYSEGMHGLALANEATAADESQIVPCCQGWVSAVLDWLKNI